MENNLKKLLKSNGLLLKLKKTCIQELSLTTNQIVQSHKFTEIDIPDTTTNSITGVITA